MSDTGKDRMRGGCGERKFCDARLSVVSIKVSGREKGHSWRRIDFYRNR